MKDCLSPRGIRFALWALIAALIGAGSVPGGASAGDRALTVVELFTSQGCSSCPPADEYLAVLAERPDVLALSFHVDYWDYIGWKDPFAKGAYTERQRQYQGFFNLRYVYTPQMVTDGVHQAVGSKRHEIAAHIRNAQTQLPKLDVSMVRGSGTVDIRVASADGSGVEVQDAAIWLVAFDDRHQTAVARGENKGRQIANRTVVRRFDLVGTGTGTAFYARVAVPVRGEPGGDGVAVLVQSLVSGHILGAARLAPGG
jgi:hypothetical protein